MDNDYFSVCVCVGGGGGGQIRASQTLKFLSSSET